jgi:hypothetical protein
MASPDLTQALAALDNAAGSLLSDRQVGKDHDTFIAGAIDALSQFYLFTEADGTVHDLTDQVYRNHEKIILGDLPGAIEPLLTYLESKTLAFKKAIDSGDFMLPSGVEADWATWPQRLAFYRKVQQEELQKGARKPSARLYKNVTAPLLTGFYPVDHPLPGIVLLPSNPAAKKKPDVTTLATTWYVTGLFNSVSSPLQQWMGQWDTGLTKFVGDVTSFLETLAVEGIEVVKRAAKSSLGFLAKAAIWLGVGYAAWKAIEYVGNRSDDDRNDLDDWDPDDPNDLRGLTDYEKDPQGLAKDIDRKRYEWLSNLGDLDADELAELEGLHVTLAE